MTTLEHWELIELLVGRTTADIQKYEQELLELRKQVEGLQLIVKLDGERMVAAADAHARRRAARTWCPWCRAWTERGLGPQPTEETKAAPERLRLWCKRYGGLVYACRYGDGGAICECEVVLKEGLDEAVRMDSEDMMPTEGDR